MIRLRAAFLVATVGGSGYFPVASGTVGSLVALGMAYGMVRGFHLAPLWFGFLAALLFWPACWSAGVVGRHLGRVDPSVIVIDEVVGQWIAVSVVRPAEWKDWLAAFLLFRLFDIWKPFGVRRLEKLPAGYGVVADDAGAGLCAMIVLSGLHWISVW